MPGKKRGRNPLETWAEFTKDSYETIRVESNFSDEDLVTYENAIDLGRDMIEMYLELYGEDPEWEVIAVEKRFAVRIPDPNDPTKAIAIDVGTFDLVIRNIRTGKIWLVDHKTCKAFEYRHLTIDDQGGSYCALATFALREEGLIGPKESVQGIIYNFLRKAKRDTRPEDSEGRKLNKPEKKHYAAALANADMDFVDYDAAHKYYMKKTLVQLEEEATHLLSPVGGEVSKLQPKPIFYRHEVRRTLAERNQQIRRIGNDVKLMNLYRDGTIEVGKSPQKDCANFCDYFDLCEVDEANGDTDNMKDLMFTVQDPYADHREGAENSKTSVKADVRRKKVPNG